MAETQIEAEAETQVSLPPHIISPIMSNLYCQIPELNSST